MRLQASCCHSIEPHVIMSNDKNIVNKIEMNNEVRMHAAILHAEFMR